MHAAAPAAGPAQTSAPRPPLTPKSAPEPARSQRIEQLHRQLHGGAVAAVVLERFWDELEEHGTPLVEPLADDPGYCAVTFLWRDRHGLGEGTRSVLLLANKLTDPSVREQSLLVRIEGTDVWHRSYRLRSDWRASYQFSPDDGAGALAQAGAGAPHGGGGPDRVGIASGGGRGTGAGSASRGNGAAPGARGRWRGLGANAQPDPLARERLAALGTEAPSSVVELPDAPPQPWLHVNPKIARGAVTEHRLTSDRLGNERRVWLYEPPPAADPTKEPLFMVMLNGEQALRRLAFAATLDNLIAAGRIPPVYAVLPAPVGREHGCHASFVEFLCDELLPWAEARWGRVAQPGQTVIAGQSIGGLAALHTALRAPHRFGNVLVQSASLWWPGDPMPDIPGDWLMREYAVAPRVDVRFQLSAGLQEWVLLPLHRHLRDVLTAKGNAVTLTEYYGGHDSACWRGLIADGLLALTADIWPLHAIN